MVTGECHDERGPWLAAARRVSAGHVFATRDFLFQACDDAAIITLASGPKDMFLEILGSCAPSGFSQPAHHLTLGSKTRRRSVIRPIFKR
jgi:hypothetical protein